MTRVNLMESVVSITAGCLDQQYDNPQSQGFLKFMVWLILLVKGKFSGHVNQYVTYIHSCLQLAILIKMSNKNPSGKLVVLESFAKPSFGCHFDSQGLV